MNWLTGVYWYMGMGLVLGALALPVAMFRKWKGGSGDSMLEALNPERSTVWYKFRERVLLPLLLLPVMAIGWPLVLAVVGHSAWHGRRCQW